MVHCVAMSEKGRAARNLQRRKVSVLSSDAFRQADFAALYRRAVNPRERRRFLSFLLLQAGLSVSEVAVHLGVSEVAVYIWLRGYASQRKQEVNRSDPDPVELPASFASESFTQLYRESFHARSKIRYLGLSLLQEGNRSVSEVASILRVSRGTVYGWLSLYRSFGVAGLSKRVDWDRIGGMPSSFASEDFVSLYRAADGPRAKIRYLCLSLLQGGDHTVEEVASMLHVNRVSVYAWLRRYRDRGIKG